MEFEEPRGCRIMQMRLMADSQESFEAASEALGLEIHGEIGPIATEDGAYTYRYASKQIGELNVTLESPRRMMRMVPVDA